MLHLRLINPNLSLCLFLKSLITSAWHGRRPKPRWYIVLHLRSAVSLIFLFQQTAAAVPKTQAHYNKNNCLEATWRTESAYEQPPCATVCLFNFYEHTLLQCLWFGTQCVSVVSTVYWHAELKYTFFKGERFRTCLLHKITQKESVCLHQGVVF